MFMLDTDLISIIQEFQQPEYGRLSARMGNHPDTEFFVSVISFHEQVMGAHTYVNRAKTAAGASFGYEYFHEALKYFCNAQVLPFDPSAATIFDNLRSAGVRIPTMDLRIAAIALVNNKTLLTRNLRDFQMVPGLTAQDWTL
jgi:tRNA(fMet)-specific endonuclease VapC